MYGFKRDDYIYLVVCTETKRMYVGRSERHGRMHTHLMKLRRRKHPIALMQHDFDKYGEKAFTFTVIQGDYTEGFEEHTSPSEFMFGNVSEDWNSECEWMERFQTNNPNFGYNYLDGYFISNSLMNRKQKKEYVSKKYNFDVKQL